VSGRNEATDADRDTGPPAAPHVVAARCERARDWVIASDPGLLRLRMATRTILGMSLSLVVLYALTAATGAPLTVALLGAVITMTTARAVNEPRSRQQRVTLALLPVPATLSITAAALLASHKVAADVVFVLVTFAAVYIRRFGARGMAAGMTAFMTYFFTLFLSAGTAELPWLIVAVVIGSLGNFVISGYLLPDRPHRVLHRTWRSLRSQMALVVDTAADTLQATGDGDKTRRRLRARVSRLNETALMVQAQIDDKVDPAKVWPGVGGEELALRLFDAELTVERVAAAAGRAAVAGVAHPPGAELIEALRQLSADMRAPESDRLAHVTELARSVIEAQPADTETRRLALAIVDAAAAGTAIRAMIERADAEHADADAPAGPPGGDGPDADRRSGLRPTTRQAVQVSLAVSLAIVVGEQVAPSRWYWAVIATFVTFAGTTSRGETLTKGWQRLVGTALGVPAGMLIATLVSENPAASVVLIFVCLFFAFYLMTVSYAWMMFWITTMMALLYGLLGQFSAQLLLLRIEETAIGAVIGVAVAVLVLPSPTGTAVRDEARAFFTTLTELIELCVATLLGDRADLTPTEKARGLDRTLQQFRVSAKPLTVGVAGLAGRQSIRGGLRLLTACDGYARTLARCCDGAAPLARSPLARAFVAAAEHTQDTIGALVTVLDHRGAGDVVPGTDLLDDVVGLAGDGPDARRLLAAAHALRQIDRAVAGAAVDLGAGDIKLW
jgi:uncharacterized membrane protein YccC